MSHFYGKLADVFYFYFAANDTSGSGDDGASPAADVRLAGAAQGAAPVHSPTPILLTNASFPAGLHEIEITASAGNGYANGTPNVYAVFCTLAVDAQNPSGFVGSFELSANGGLALRGSDDDTLKNLSDQLDVVQTRLPASLVSGKMNSDATAISGSTEAADNLEASAKTIVTGAAIAGTLSLTEMTTNLTETTNDHYNGRRLIWTSGVLQDQATAITDYDGVTKKLTFTGVTEAPSIGDTFNIV